jgi:hypothetical protein
MPSESQPNVSADCDDLEAAIDQAIAACRVSPGNAVKADLQTSYPGSS